MSLRQSVRVPLKDFLLDANHDIKKTLHINGDVVIQGNSGADAAAIASNKDIKRDILIEGNTLKSNTQTLFRDSERSPDAVFVFEPGTEFIDGALAGDDCRMSSEDFSGIFIPEAGTVEG